MPVSNSLPLSRLSVTLPESSDLHNASVCRRTRLRLLDPAALQIRPRDPSLLPELHRHFERSGFRVQQQEGAIEVERPDAPDDEQAAREIRLHLDVWLVMHPDSIALVGDAD